MNANRLHSILHQLGSGFQNVALGTADGQLLFLKYENLSDIGTLPRATQTVTQYLPPDDGDIVMVNDPYSGGSTLSSLYLVMGIQPLRQAAKKSPLLYACMRLAFRPRFQLARSLEEEGLRIPPTPVKIKGMLNREILEIIAAHPQAPDRFRDIVDEGVKSLISYREQLRQLTGAFQLDWGKVAVKQFLQASQRRMLSRLTDLSVGEALCEVNVEGTKLRLRMEITDGKMVFDFTGTESASDIHLTEGATFGACVGALSGALDGGFPINSGALQAIEVLTPQGTMVNARYPKPVYLGMTDGLAIVAGMVSKVLGMIDPKRQLPMAPTGLCTFQVEFEDGRWFFETLEPGAPGIESRAGVDGLNLWRRSSLQPSVEEIEKRYPVLIQTFTYRQNSGGSGAQSGGNGVTKSLKLLQAGTLRWNVIEPFHKPEGIRGGKAGDPPEISITPPEGERERLPGRGERALVAGTVITLQSAGGGGYGAPETE